MTDLVCFSFRCRSRYLPVARSEAERARPVVKSFRRPPPKASPHRQMRSSTLSVPQDPSAPGTSPPSLLRTVSPDPVPRSNRHYRVDLSRPSAFLFHRCGGDFSFGKTKEKWGPYPRAAKRRTPPSPPRGRTLSALSEREKRASSSCRPAAHRPAPYGRVGPPFSQSSHSGGLP